MIGMTRSPGRTRAVWCREFDLNYWHGRPCDAFDGRITVEDELVRRVNRQPASGDDTQGQERSAATGKAAADSCRGRAFASIFGPFRQASRRVDSDRILL